MTTCRDIISIAMGRLRLKRAGEEPTGTEADDGMIALQSLYTGWITTGLFGRMNDTIISGNYIAQEQDRVINDGGYTVTLPTTIVPSSPSGSYFPMWPDERIWSALQTTTQRPPRDLSLICVIGPDRVPTHSVYSARTRIWVSLDALTLISGAPLAGRNTTGLASCLAELIADDYGATVPPGVKEAATLYKWSLSARYDSQRVAGMADYF